MGSPIINYGVIPPAATTTTTVTATSESLVTLAELPAVPTTSLVSNRSKLSVLDEVNETVSDWVFQITAPESGDVTPNDRGASARWRQMGGY